MRACMLVEVLTTCWQVFEILLLWPRKWWCFVFGSALLVIWMLHQRYLHYDGYPGCSCCDWYVHRHHPPPTWQQSKKKLMSKELHAFTRNIVNTWQMNVWTKIRECSITYRDSCHRWGGCSFSRLSQLPQTIGGLGGHLAHGAVHLLLQLPELLLPLLLLLLLLSLECSGVAHLDLDELLLATSAFANLLMILVEWLFGLALGTS